MPMENDTPAQRGIVSRCVVIRCARTAALTARLGLAKQSETVLQRLYARESKAQGSRIGAAKLMGQRLDGLALAIRLSRRSGFGDRLTNEGKRHIKRGCCGS